MQRSSAWQSLMTFSKRRGRQEAFQGCYHICHHWCISCSGSSGIWYLQIFTPDYLDDFDDEYDDEFDDDFFEDEDDDDAEEEKRHQRLKKRNNRF